MDYRRIVAQPFWLWGRRKSACRFSIRQARRPPAPQTGKPVLRLGTLPAEIDIVCTVIITGSAGLIGSETVQTFARAGAAVMGIDNDMRAEFFDARRPRTPKHFECDASSRRFEKAALAASLKELNASTPNELNTPRPHLLSAARCDRQLRRHEASPR